MNYSSNTYVADTGRIDIIINYKVNAQRVS